MVEVRDAPAAGVLQVETNGLDVIADGERKGRPQQLFWPWFAANVSLVALVLAFVATLVGSRPQVRAQEARTP